MLFLVQARFDLNALMSADIQALGAQEAERMAALHKDGTLLGIWRRADATGAVSVLNVESGEQLAELNRSLPLFSCIRTMDALPIIPHPLFPQFGPGRGDES